jgi:hypothetical protein
MYDIVEVRIVYDYCYCYCFDMHFFVIIIYFHVFIEYETIEYECWLGSYFLFSKENNRLDLF